MNNLFRIAEKFENLSAQNGKIIKNNDEVLEEISSLNDFEERVKLAEEHYDKLGEGSSRTIFQISDSLVLKVAKSDKGIAQNTAEMSMRADCLNNVLAADTEGKWVIVRFTETMSEEDFKDVVGFGFKSLMKGLYYFGNNEVHDGKPDEYDEIVELPLFRCLSKLVLDEQLQIGDVSKSSSWGLIDGRVVLRDFGLTKDVFIDHYEDDEDNNATTV